MAILLALAVVLGLAGGCSSGGGTQTLFTDGGDLEDGAVVDSSRSDTSTADSSTDAGRFDAADAAKDALADVVAIDASNLPSLSVNNVSVAEGSTGTTSMTFTVTLSTPSAQTVTVNYATLANGTASTSSLAVGGSDFTPLSGGLTFVPGDKSKTVTVSVRGDTTNEPNETFSLQLSNAVNATIAGSGTGTILDDDAPPAVSVTDALLIEGNSGTTIASFVATLSAPSGNSVSVHYKTTDGTATAASSDYTAITDTIITFAAGETTKPINVSVIGDTTTEPNETFTVDLFSPNNAILGKATGTATIQNDDGGAVPTLSIGSPAITEGNSSSKILSFTVTLSASSAQTVTVDYATADGTATTAGNDYQGTVGTLSFAPGVTTNNVSVVVYGDTSDEDNESFTVTLSNAQNANVLGAQGTGTITNDDSPPSVTIGNAGVTEGQAGTSSLTFTVSLSSASGKSVSVDYASADGTATAGGVPATGGQDYGAASGTVVFPPGTTSQLVSVSVSGDTLNEANETMTVTLSNPGNASLGGATTGTGTITNDDPLPNIAIENASMTEGNSGTTDLVFTVSLLDGASNIIASGRTVTVSYATANGTATAGSDFTATNGTVTFNPGETQKTISVPVVGDTAAETNETFTVGLTSPSNALISGATGTGTITNDDGSLPFLNVSDAAVAEGNSGTKQLTFTVTLSAATAQAVTVDFATQDGTATSGGLAANGGQDFAAANGTVSFAAGETSKQVAIAINGDTISEIDEAFQLLLSNPSSNAAIQDGVGSGAISNDDTAPSVSIADASTSEGNAGTKSMSFTVTLSAVSGRTVTVAYSTADGTAKTSGAAIAGGADYAYGSGTVSFAPGETSKNVLVTINGDTTREDNETLGVTLSSPSGASLGTSSATGTITNDDANPSISIANVTAAEGTPSVGTPSTTAFVFNVTLSNSYEGTITVKYDTANGTATWQSNDYDRLQNQTLTFAAGETLQTITVLVQKDSTAEGNETFSVQLSSPSPATIATLGTSSATGTITNDD